MAGSDFSSPCIIGFGLPAFPTRTTLSQMASHETSRFPDKTYLDYALPSVTKHLIADRKFCVVS
jgi:hypothetical protein